MSALAQEQMKWAQRCGKRMGALRKKQHSCTVNARDKYSDTIDVCNEIESGSVSHSMGFSYFDLYSFTINPAVHGNQYCSDKMKNARDKHFDKCDYDFDNSKLKDTSCAGAAGWGIKR
ncbi:hypothetical protein QWI17_13035 [Gilvimarinus sp. SDUM040013]|uniref:Uncharacterized protein n=1 Tax=Gilvimarinus gilvus TaxID=3058038 RepID=A0ABU4RVS2_9GAMM|nr:hypothetical protein [Gilvimarinus sp. SDUM040013]MDO3386764.1 hypothetical protein [Gilvimarinus sp. SDUM040013]MDX6848306.1 hypothetical protein [Gilvimarinus sp. SDUM040013]